MKVKNKKGFTLVELIGVISLLAVVVLITVPVVSNQIERAKEKSYTAQMNTILESTKKYAVSEVIGLSNTKKYNYDIVFVLDDSSSMNGDCTNPETANSLERLKNSVDARNEIMKRYLVDSQNRVGIVTFHGVVSTLLPLDHYTSETGNYIETIPLYTSEENPYYTSPSCHPEEGSEDRMGPYYNIHKTYRVLPGVRNSSLVEIESKQIWTGGYTNSQEGIYRGMKMLVDNPSDNVPILFFVTDGIVSYNVHSNYITPTDDNLLEYSNKQENIYNTILTSMYYKYYIYNMQKRMPKIYSIGLGITGDIEKAFLNPNEKNLSSSNWFVKKVKELLESNDNPYKDNYQYVENSFVGSYLSNEDIKSAIGSSIENSTEVYEIELQELVDNGYLPEEALINPKTGEDFKGYVSIKYVRKNDEFLLCNYNESTNKCKYIYKFIDTSNE